MNKFDTMPFSSFDQILYMDSANNKLSSLSKNPFARGPFKATSWSSSLITRKDWTSSYFFQTTNLSPPSAPDKACTESAQIMIHQAHRHYTSPNSFQLLSLPATLHQILEQTRTAKTVKKPRISLSTNLQTTQQDRLQL